MSKDFFEDIEFEHRVDPRLKHSYLRVLLKEKSEGYSPYILLKTPKVSQRYVADLLSKKKLWIQKQLQKLQHSMPKRLEGEVELFGLIYSLDDSAVVSLQKSLQKQKDATQAKVMQAYDVFYKKVAQEYLPQRLEYFAKRMGLSYKELRLRKMKRCWGSCSSLGVITLNTKLIRLEKQLIDYVLVHELAHLVHMNHSKDFHRLVAFYLPDERELRQVLKNSYLV